ncbi:hypothetical protein RN001_009900 [Aquatica leii]|uniref:Sulfotransferase domain-containing protein n=1 Tax=Aquatica leii TaxID=1421715 RepID=A0AAN7SFU6_9COLE|nr:hypothetical protein RN001_009900 [Aquatica leii]
MNMSFVVPVKESLKMEYQLPPPPITTPNLVPHQVPVGVMQGTLNHIQTVQDDNNRWTQYHQLWRQHVYMNVSTMSVYMKVIGNDSKLGKILNRDFLGERSRYIEVGTEKIMLPGKFEEYYERIKDFEVRDDDVYILAFPKTGSRWVQEMVWLLLNNLDFKKACEVSLDLRSPLLELEAIFENLVGDFHYFDAVVNLESPRCIRSHLIWPLLPTAISNGTKQPKIIVILRDPEDICTSYYYQAKGIEGYSGNWNDFCELFLGGKVPFGPFWKHVLSFWEQRHRPNIMFVSYKKMKADLIGNIRNVASFLGKKLSEEDVIRMHEHLTFDNLKKSEGFNMEHLIKIKKVDVNPFIRTGVVGGHKNVMSPEVIEAFKQQREHYLTGTDLTFD